MLVCVDDGGMNKFPDSVVLVGQVRPWWGHRRKALGSGWLLLHGVAETALRMADH